MSVEACLEGQRKVFHGVACTLWKAAQRVGMVQGGPPEDLIARVQVLRPDAWRWNYQACFVPEERTAFVLPAAADARDVPQCAWDAPLEEIRLAYARGLPVDLAAECMLHEIAHLIADAAGLAGLDGDEHHGQAWHAVVSALTTELGGRPPAFKDTGWWPSGSGLWSLVDDTTAALLPFVLAPGALTRKELARAA